VSVNENSKTVINNARMGNISLATPLVQLTEPPHRIGRIPLKFRPGPCIVPP
jgi:hypothetical protein